MPQLLGKKQHRSMRLFLFYIALFLSGVLCANPEDSVVEGRIMSQLVIMSNRPKHPLFAQRDSLLLMRSNHLSLGAFLEKSASANVMNYGAPGAIITARFNGSSSDHALFLWNEMPLTNPALGLTDLSLIPMAFLSGMQLSNDVVASQGGQSGIGGTVQIQDRTAFNGVSMQVLSNSLNNQHAVFRIGFSKQRFSSLTQIMMNSAANEFDYIDEYQLRKPRVSQSHNNSRQRAIQQQFLVASKNKQHTFKWVGFYQIRQFNVPVTMGLNKFGTAHQRDSVMRASFNYEWRNDWNRKYFKSSELSVFSSISNEFQRYTDRFTPSDESLSIDSRVNTLVWMNGLRTRWNGFFFLDRLVVEVKHFHQVANNSNYVGGQWKEPFLSFNSYGERFFFNRRLKWSSFVYHEQRETFKTEPSFGSELLFDMSDQSIWIPAVFIKATRKFRVPDFNERFWVVGGNRNLLPEEGMIYSSRLSWDGQSSRHWEWFIGAEFGKQFIDGWIQWVPMPQWTPVNYKETEVTYFNGQLQVSIPFDRWIWHVKTNYHFIQSKARNTSLERTFELTYTPRHAYALAVDMTHGKWTGGIHYRFVSDRFTDETNSTRMQLPSYGIWDVFFGFKWRKHELQVFLDNALDERYEMVRSYALPGRVIGLNYQLYIHFSPRKK